MIKGCINLKRDALFRQGNNILDIIDGPALVKCNDTAIVMGWAAVVYNFDTWKNPFSGSYRGWQPEDLVDLYFHDEKNWKKFREERRKTSSDVKLCHEQPHDGMYPPEQLPQLHQLALREVFGIGADFSYKADFQYVAEQVSNGVACILRLKSPGHFITAVCYDDEKRMIGFKDPAPVKWLQITEDKNGNKWVNIKDFKDNIHTDVTRAWRI